MNILFLSLGTSILPPSLNFFNIGNKKEKQESKSIRISTEKISATNTNITETQKQETCQKNMTKVKPAVSDKKKMPSTIHKNITKLKTTASTVQALKKKYQEQRLAKQRIKNKFKTTCVMRTRSCTERAMLKAGIQLTPRKFLPGIETKRHGLRSGVLPDKTKSLSKTKVLPPKTKKKVNLKSKNSDTSNTDTSSEEEDHEEDDQEEDLPTGKSTTQIKRNVQRSIQKKICTRSKSEMRRVTRSYSGTITSQNLTRRPTRKTKEAAAVYMEILGRKLVSPDLENDDNGSVESFPELPNARRIAQTESELKAKVKQTRTIGKTKDSKTNSFNGNKRLDKSKNKLILKSKRLMRVQRYCEEISDDESESSIETNNTRPITRQSLGKVDKPISRSLRSSSKNTTLQTELQSNTNSKLKTQVQNMKSIREKFTVKRKRDQNVSKTLSEKTGGSKQKTSKTDQNENAESEEETLGMLLNKIKKKKENDDEEEENTKVVDNVNDMKESEVVHNKVQTTKPDSSLKVSDDEGSFHGFTKKAISKVLTSFQTHANTNLLTTETDEKLNLLKTLHVLPIVEQGTSRENKEVEASSPVMNLNDECSMSMQDQKSVLDLSIKTQSSLIPSAEQMEKKCNHENEISANLIDMSSLSVMHTRKEQENMSTERIKKWLNESSLAKEESKLEMENVSTFRYDPTEKLKTDVSHLSISTKIQHLVRPVNVTLSKLTDKTNMKDRMGIHNRNIIPIVSDNIYNIDVKLQNTIDNKNKINVEAKDIAKNKNEKTSKDIPPIEDTSDTISKSDQNSMDGSIEKKSSTEKKIFQLRKPFLPKVKERKTVTPNANAFSPENESSVYAFESDTEIPISTPFRRKVKETAKSTMMIATSTTISETKVSAEINKLDKNESEVSECKEKSSSDDDILEKKEQETQGLISVANTNLNVNKFELPKNFASLSNVQILPLDKLTTNWSNVNCSASIAVQVNLDETTQEQDNNQQRSTEISTQTETNNENDDDNDGQLFYIPLQAVTRNGPNLVQGQQLIQGVAVKLGTEGPTGPNQRVLLRAKLVTKPPLSVARCPPIGTVQPTTRSPPNPTAITVEQQIPSTSTTTTTSTTMTNIPTTENTQLTSSLKNDIPSTNPNRQNVSISANNTLEKLTKSPKSSRERKASIDSTKSGKRYYLILYLE